MVDKEIGAGDLDQAMAFSFASAPDGAPALRWDVAKVATSTESKGRQQPRKRQAGRH
jgi:hypothetical protein